MVTTVYTCPSLKWLTFLKSGAENNSQVPAADCSSAAQVQQNNRSNEIDRLMKCLISLYRKACLQQELLSQQMQKEMGSFSGKIIDQMKEKLSKISDTIGESTIDQRHRETWEEFRSTENCAVSLIEKVLDHPSGLVGGLLAVGAGILLAICLSAATLTTWSSFAPIAIMLGWSAFMVGIDFIIHNNPHSRLTSIRDKFVEVADKLIEILSSLQVSENVGETKATDHSAQVRESPSEKVSKEEASHHFKAVIEDLIALIEQSEQSIAATPLKDDTLKLYQSIKDKYSCQQTLKWYDLVGLKDKDINVDVTNRRPLQIKALSHCKDLKELSEKISNTAALKELIDRIGIYYIMRWAGGKETAEKLNKQWEDFIQSWTPKVTG